MPSPSEYRTALSKSSVNMDRIDRFVNGTPIETVETDNGPISTLAKLQADVGLAGDTVALAAAAAEAADDAAASAAQAEADAVLLQVSGVTPLTAITGSGTNATNTTACYFNREYLQDYDQFIFGFSTGMAAAGPVDVVIARVDGANLTDGQVLGRFDMGIGTPKILIPAGLRIPAGFIPGVRATLANRILFTSGTIAGARRQRFTAALPTTPTAFTDGVVNALQFSFDVRSEVIHKALSAFDRVGTVEEQLGETAVFGFPLPIVNTGTDTPAAYAIVDQEAFPTDGTLTKVTVGAGSVAGIATIAIVSMSGLTSTIIRTATVALADGVNEITLSLPFKEGQYAAIIGGGYKFQNGSNPSGRRVWLRAGGLETGQALTDSAQHNFEVRWEYKTGLIGLVSSVSSAGSSSKSGMDLLDNADNTGATDVTAAITAAQAAHPAPYVPPGDYLVSGIPRGGNGLWGPGRLIRNTRRFYLPDSPRPTTLHEGLRQRLATCIGTGAPLVVIGDSIAHWSAASSDNNHWLDQLCGLANINHSPLDVPIMTSFGSIASYTPAFYGVTLSGTTSGGSRGPIGNATAGSVVLASGAAMTFTGTFAQIAFTFIREPGAGTLTVSRGATTLVTIDANGALDLDRWSDFIATGVTDIATYTITASGGSVEVTSLLRRGVRSATDIRRLNVMRAARGSFTFGDYTQPKVDSILKIASHLSPSPPTVMIALGINDAAGISTASAMATAANAVIDRFIAGGVSDFIGILPLRPDQTVSAWQTRAANYDAVLAGLTQSYRAKSVQIIRPASDYLAGGLFTDGLHPGNAGNVQYLRQLLGQIA